MGCVPCGQKNRQVTEYVWTSADGKSRETYVTENAARAQVIRNPGSTYVPVVK